jgi:hypothetical protein
LISRRIIFENPYLYLFTWYGSNNIIINSSYEMIAEKEAIVIGEKQPHGQNSMHGVIVLTLENI